MDVHAIYSFAIYTLKFDINAACDYACEMHSC